MNNKTKHVPIRKLAKFRSGPTRRQWFAIFLIGIFMATALKITDPSGNANEDIAQQDLGTSLNHYGSTDGSVRILIMNSPSGDFSEFFTKAMSFNQEYQIFEFELLHSLSDLGKFENSGIPQILITHASKDGIMTSYGLEKWSDVNSVIKDYDNFNILSCYSEELLKYGYTQEISLNKGLIDQVVGFYQIIMKLPDFTAFSDTTAKHYFEQNYQFDEIIDRINQPRKSLSTQVSMLVAVEDYLYQKKSNGKTRAEFYQWLETDKFPGWVASAESLFGIEISVDFVSFVDSDCDYSDIRTPLLKIRYPAGCTAEDSKTAVRYGVAFKNNHHFFLDGSLDESHVIKRIKDSDTSPYNSINRYDVLFYLTLNGRYSDYANKPIGGMAYSPYNYMWVAYNHPAFQKAEIFMHEFLHLFNATHLGHGDEVDGSLLSSGDIPTGAELIPEMESSIPTFNQLYTWCQDYANNEKLGTGDCTTDEPNFKVYLEIKGDDGKSYQFEFNNWLTPPVDNVGNTLDTVNGLTIQYSSKSMMDYDMMGYSSNSIDDKIDWFNAFLVIKTRDTNNYRNFLHNQTGYPDLQIDNDNDGISDTYEKLGFYGYITNTGYPDGYDSDYDYISDGDEIKSGFNPDSIFPSVTFQTPSNHEVVNGMLKISGTVNENIGIEYIDITIEGYGTFGLQYNEEFDFAFWVDTTKLNDGSITISISTEDVNGQLGSGQITVTIDNVTPPVSSLIFNPDREYITSSNHYIAGNLQVDVSSVYTDIDRVEYKLYRNGNFLFTVTNEYPSTSLLYGEQLFHYHSGDLYQLDVTVYDTLENSYSLSKQFIPDNTAPTGYVYLYGNPTSYVSGNDRDFYTTSVSDHVGVKKVNFYLEETLKSQDTSNPYRYYNFDSNSYSEGSYTIKAKFIDYLGNSRISELNIKIDRNNPTINSISGISNGATYDRYSTLHVTVDVYDVNGISKVEFYVNGLRLQTDNSAPFECDIPTIRTGSHTFYIKVYDSVGKVTTSSTITYTIKEKGGIIILP